MSLPYWHFAHNFRVLKHALTVEKTLQISDKIFIFLSRDSMLKYLHSMYERAESGEIIWGQSVSGNIYGDVEGKIGLAATRGVKFEIIFNSEVDNKNGISLKKNLKKLFELLNATVCIRNDNNLRIQGLSSKEVVIALPNNNKYYAILIKDSALTKALYYWFQSRECFKTIKVTKPKYRQVKQRHENRQPSFHTG